MKKIAVFFISILLALGLFSCSDINGGEISYKQTTILSSSDSAFFLSVFSSERIFKSASAKTLLPSALDGSALNYYLFYINTLSSSNNAYEYYGKLSLQYNSSTTATAPLDLPSSVYTFALYATTENIDSPTINSVKNSACLLGFATADLNSVREISLRLSSSSLSSGGTANISLSSSWNFPSSWELSSGGNATVSIGIYDLATGEAVSLGGSNVNPHVLSYSAVGEISDKIHLSNYTFGNAEIPSGTYSFVVKFINYVTEKTFEYSDTIVILANQTTTASIDVPNVIDTEPLAPSDFAVGYTDPASDDLEYYLADFTWTDNANNETGFEIQIADISCGYSNIAGNSASLLIPDLSSDYNWEVSVSNAAYPSDNIATYDSDSYKDYISYYYEYFGTADYSPDTYSLIRNNKKAKFYFQLGKRYVARIRAVNDVGASEWAYAEFDGGACASINRYRISYSTKSGEVVSYASQNESGVVIDTPSDSDWQGWFVGEISDDTVYPLSGGTSEPYTGHENLILIGKYDDDDAPSEWAWADYDVVLYGLTDSAAAIDLSDLASSNNKCENGQKVGVSLSEVAGLDWIISSSAKDYDSITIKICSTRDSTTDIVSKTFDLSTKILQIPISDWQTGYYIATLYGEKDGVSYPFTVVIEVTE